MDRRVEVCVACGNREALVPLPYPEPHQRALGPRSIRWSRLDLLGCPRCGLSWVTRAPRGLDRYYRRAYSGAIGRSKHRSPEAYFASEATMFRPGRARRHLARAQAHRGHDGPYDTVLDLGPGLGNLLWMVDAKTKLAVEPDESMAPFLTYVDAERTELSAVERESVELVVTSHNLEHYPASELPRVLGGIHRVLRPDGLLVAEVPAGSLLRLDVSNQRHDPHLLFFSIEALDRLLDRHGFEVLELDAAARSELSLLPDPRYVPSTDKPEYDLRRGSLTAVARRRPVLVA